MSDRSNKPSFAVSTNLKHARYHFIEAITVKLTESSNTTPNSVSTSTWLCVSSSMISTSHKTWRTSLLFLELLQIQNLQRKSGEDIAYYVPPPEKVGGHVPLVPHQIAPMDYYKHWVIARHETCALIWPIPIYIYPALSETSISYKWGLPVHHNYSTSCCANWYFVSHRLVSNMTWLQTPKQLHNNLNMYMQNYINLSVFIGKMFLVL